MCAVTLCATQHARCVLGPKQQPVSKLGHLLMAPGQTKAFIYATSACAASDCRLLLHPLGALLATKLLQDGQHRLLCEGFQAAN